MKKIRTIVVDDEPLARARIVHLLQQFEYIQLIGECKNGKEALDKIQQYQPDLVFLDVQMPDFSGFDVLTKAGKGILPFIIFVTAYDQYALKAFGVHAVDYLLKPYDDERFTIALEHAKKQIYLKENALLHQKMVQLLEDHKAKTVQGLTHFEIKEKGKATLLNVADTYYFESHGNYVKIHQREKSFLYRQTLAALREQLNQDQFLQIHRSILINRHFIQSAKYIGNNQYLVRLKNETELTSSRGYREEIYAYLEDKDLRSQ
ncbi:MAG: DNA-binding response regulator [Saprospiraceae bacterium]|nr:MAG: DNA-binding response regulator [Saprospiraceae bacterium]